MKKKKKIYIGQADDRLVKPLTHNGFLSDHNVENRACRARVILLEPGKKRNNINKTTIYLYDTIYLLQFATAHDRVLHGTRGIAHMR